jgi:hypothetical protein
MDEREWVKTWASIEGDSDREEESLEIAQIVVGERRCSRLVRYAKEGEAKSQECPRGAESVRMDAIER